MRLFLYLFPDYEWRDSLCGDCVDGILCYALVHLIQVRGPGVATSNWPRVGAGNTRSDTCLSLQILFDIYLIFASLEGPCVVAGAFFPLQLRGKRPSEPLSMHHSDCQQVCKMKHGYANETRALPYPTILDYADFFGLYRST